MARPMWSGSISFGLVQIPVGLHTAEDREESIRLTLLDKKDHSPVGYRHVNKTTGEEVPKERRVKGYEVARDEYVILTDDDFKRANVRATETIDIHSFVDAREIPVTRYEKPYYVAPARKGARPYVLLLEALRRTNKVGIATVVMRQRQHLCAVMPMDEVLVLEMLRYDAELAQPKGLGLPEGADAVSVTVPELEMATTLINGMSAPFSTQKFHDAYHDDLMRLIDERRAHPEHVPEPPHREKRRGEVVDIMSLLKQSIEERTARGAGPHPAQQEQVQDDEQAPARRSSRSARGAPRARSSKRARA